jgi:Na+:H+ antiporter, NhaA family
MREGTPEPPAEGDTFDQLLRFPWARSDRRIPRLILRPLQTFFRTEVAGGLLLLAAAVIALAWANSPLSESYERLWATELVVRLGDWVVAEDLRHLVTDALMAIFFFVVGLEIKRELVTGELRDPRAAVLPVLGAVGGMVVPALVYLALNPAGDPARGWGIPMATDIAFALGVLALLGRRVPSSLRLFLLALAIVDDIGAIAVIAIFYSQGISAQALSVAAGLLVLMMAALRLQIRAMPMYVVLGAGVWLATYLSGVHATIAGVVLGIMAPARPFQRPAAVSQEARRVAGATEDDPEPPDVDAEEWLWLAHLSREAVSPLARLESVLHPWASFVIVPVFALANAGVDLRGGALDKAVSSPVALGVLVGLVAGKTVGIAGAAWLGCRLGVARLPGRVSWRQVVGVAALAGIGFTVSLFITQVAFDHSRLRDAAKVGIMAASLLAGVVGTAILALRSGRPTGSDRRGAQAAPRL